MPAHDQTNAFHSILDDRLASSSSSSSNGNGKSSRPKSPFGGRGRAGDSRSPSRSTKGKGKGKGKDVEEEEEFLKEAYRIHAHLASLTHLLKTVRKAYLSTIEPPPLSRRNRDRPDIGLGSGSNSKAQDEGTEGEWRKWEKVKYLTDKERDEIDLRARMILRRCRDRVGVLELSEQARKSKAPSSSSNTQQAILSFLPSLLASEEQTNLSRIYPPIITAHRASVLWYLNTYLSKLTSTLSDLQEERFKRREERGRSLGAGASLELASIGAKKHLTLPSTSTSGGKGGRKIPDGMIVDVHDPAFTFNGSGDPHLGGIGIIDPSSGPPVESQLTPAQIQQFESENNVLLDQMSTTLSSVLSAESSLLEISQLQSELIQHLSSQNEMIDQLYEDAIGSLGSLGDANEQLKKARERGKESRLFLIVFLLGASLGLLFLDWYAK
ncbi:hypothetical protein IAT40_000274 [Kwoniella sp. CBS 6097]